MHDGSNENSVFVLSIEDAEREAVDQPLADAGAFDWARIREALDSAGRLFDGLEKIYAKALRSCLVEARRLQHFLVSPGVKFNSQLLTASEAFLNASAAGIPLVFPERSSSRRRSASANHSFSTSVSA